MFKYSGDPQGGFYNTAAKTARATSKEVNKEE